MKGWSQNKRSRQSTGFKSEPNKERKRQNQDMARGQGGWGGDSYHHHGKQDKAGGGGLSGAILGINERIDRRGDEDHATGEIARHGNVVGVYGVAGNDDKDPDDQEKTVDYRPPGESGESVIEGIRDLYLGNDAGDEGDKPGQLGARQSKKMSG